MNTRTSACSRSFLTDGARGQPCEVFIRFWTLVIAIAGRVAAFSNKLIRAAVHTGEYSDPDAEQQLGDVLTKRRDKILQVYLNAVNPIVNLHLDSNGRLTFENAPLLEDVPSEPAAYRASWFRFDNTPGTQSIADTQSVTTTIELPPGLPTAVGSFVAMMSLNGIARLRTRQFSTAPALA